MQKLSMSILVLSAVSCSSGQITKVDGLDRVELAQNNYTRPQFFVKKYKPTKASRSIASTEEENELTELSNKKVYFFTLWQEYKAFKNIIGTGEKLNSCPQFHDDVLSKEKIVNNKIKLYDLDTNFETVKLDPKNIVHYPVLSIPYKGVDLYSYLKLKDEWDNAKKHTYKALTAYNERNFTELKTLCDEGNSEGYYIYENMISYYKDNKEFQNSYQALTSILKVNTISNMLILDSIVKPEYKTAHIAGFQSALLEKLKVSWFKNYLYETNLIRNNNKKRFVLKD